MTRPNETIFTSGTGDVYRNQAEIACIQNGLRLESDDLIYNAYGVAVARYKGGDERGLQFENLRLEKDFDRARILQRG